jgi:magnesium-transporting ATPase (P-type)
MAPKQKSAIVELIKHKLGVITLAVGDGANDVPMIQAAHVGVGIRGKEGLQAVNNSDYAIGQFRFLSRLLLVHGRLSYKRNTKLILYSFYKSMAITFTQFYFSMFSAFSGAELFDGILLNTFNLFFASLPIIALAVFDRDLNTNELLEYPELYRTGIAGTGFDYRVFWSWLVQGMVHAIFIFFLPFFVLRELGFWAQSMAVYSALVVVANLKLAAITTTWTWINHLVTWGSIGFYFGAATGLSSDAAIDLFPLLYGVFPKVLDSPDFWLCLLLVAWLAVMGDYIGAFFKRTRSRPSLKMVVQERRVFGPSPAARIAPEVASSKRPVLEEASSQRPIDRPSDRA